MRKPYCQLSFIIKNEQNNYNNGEVDHMYTIQTMSLCEKNKEDVDHEMSKCFETTKKYDLVMNVQKWKIMKVEITYACGR